MNDKLKRLEDIKIENIVWIIYIGIIILSWYANSKEKKYLLYGDLLSKKDLKLEPKNATLEIAGGVGNLEISIWNFSQVEDNDYVQVFIDGVAQGAPFSIRHKPVKISVPDKGVIQVQGVRDGSNNGITYAVFFNKTGETYLNTVPLNSMNTYTIISK